MPAKGNDAKPAELLLTHWSRPVYSHALHFITSIMRRALFFFLLPVITSSLHAQPSEDTVRRKVIGKEVIVTGFPAVEGTTPAPITTYDRQTLQPRTTIQDVPQLIATNPSAMVYSYNGTEVGYSFISIRGFDQRRLSILVNGIPQNDPEDHNVYWIDMPDLGSNTGALTVERGAGAAFYGPPAIGGSINVETTPNAQRQISFSAGYGGFNTQKYSATLNSGIIDGKYLILARLSQTTTDGYRDHSFVNLNSYYLSASRFDSTFSLQANFYGGPISDGLNYYGVIPTKPNRPELTDPILRKINYSEPFTYERRPEEREDFFQPHYELLSTWNPSSLLKISNSVFYIHSAGQFDFDGTWVKPATGYSNSEYYRLTPAYGALYGFTGFPVSDSMLGNELVRAFVGGDQVGWLPSVELQHASGTFTAGAELRRYRSLHYGKLLSAAKLPVDLPGDYHFYEYHGGKDVISGYLSEQYLLSDKLSLVATLQAVHDRYLFFDEKPFFVDSGMSQLSGVSTGWKSYNFTVPLTFLNPRLGMNYQFASSNVFASAAYTSREPVLSAYYNAEFFSEPNFAKSATGEFDFANPLIKPERLLDLELGAQSSIIHNRTLNDLSLGLNGYYMGFTDEILKTGRTDHFGSSIVANADRTLHYGVEASLSARMIDWISLSLTVTTSHNEIVQFSKYSDSAALNAQLVGKTPIGFPSLTASTSLTLTPIEGFSFNLNARYVGRFFGDIQNSDLYTNSAYVLVNGAASYRANNLLGLSFMQFKLSAMNLTNALYTSYVERDAGFFVGAPINVFAQIEIGL
jgi:iron complex outermembrane receptor protein